MFLILDERTVFLSGSFYQGILCIYKKDDKCDLNNYRQLTLMNADYKTIAETIMNRLNHVLDSFIKKTHVASEVV